MRKMVHKKEEQETGLTLASRGLLEFFKEVLVENLLLLAH